MSPQSLGGQAEEMAITQTRARKTVKDLERLQRPRSRKTFLLAATLLAVTLNAVGEGNIMVRIELTMKRRPCSQHPDDI